MRFLGGGRRLGFLILCGLSMGLLANRLEAQEPPPPIGPFVVDIRGTIPRFGSDPQLAASRALNELELPGSGFGVDAGVHLYPLRWKAITFGVGGQVTFGRSHSSGNNEAGAVFRPVTERLTSIAPQLSLNFGNGTGWSYLSAGLGVSTWSIVPEGSEALPADSARLRTVDYGGGARWFVNRHVAFHFDVRIFQIDPGFSDAGLPGSPRTKLLILGAGVSLK